MFALEARTARAAWTVLVMAAALGLVYLLRRALLLLAFSLFFAYLISPLVTAAQRGLGLRRRRALAVALVYLVLLLALAGAGAGVGPRLRDELTNLAQKLPAMSRQIEGAAIVGSVLKDQGWAEERISQIQELVSSHTGEMIRYAQKILVDCRLSCPIRPGHGRRIARPAGVCDDRGRSKGLTSWRARCASARRRS